jgi:hypothetical protein
MNNKEQHNINTPTCKEQDEQTPYNGYEGHWPGDGSGMDDFADYNQNENGWGDW